MFVIPSALAVPAFRMGCIPPPCCASSSTHFHLSLSLRVAPAASHARFELRAGPNEARSPQLSGRCCVSPCRCQRWVPGSRPSRCCQSVSRNSPCPQPCRRSNPPAGGSSPFRSSHLRCRFPFRLLLAPRSQGEPYRPRWDARDLDRNSRACHRGRNRSRPAPIPLPRSRGQKSKSLSSSCLHVPTPANRGKNHASHRLRASPPERSPADFPERELTVDQIEC